MTPEVPSEHAVPKPTPLEPLVVSSTEIVTIREMHRLATQKACATSADEQRNLYAAMHQLYVPTLKYSQDFFNGAAGQVYIVRPARALPSNDSPICLHPFLISPDKLSIILGESDGDDDDSESSPDEMEILRRHILQQRSK